MDYQEATKFNGLGIWVVEDELMYQSDRLSASKANGFGMDGIHGFGNEDKKYNGTLVLINSRVKLEKKLLISLSHFSGEGLRWILEFEGELPIPPFLITDNLDVHVIFDGYIRLGEEQDVIDFDNSTNLNYSIISDNWFGIATVEVERVNRYVRLLAFSENSQKMISTGDNLYSPEYDCSMGKIEDIVGVLPVVEE
jgi:hypothetical protein